MTSPRALSSRRDFQRVYRDGRRARRDGVTVWVAARADDGMPRVGLAVRGGLGSAVVRNRIRRRLRAAFRELAPVSADVVIRAETPELVRTDFQELVTDLSDAVAAAGSRT